MIWKLLKGFTLSLFSAVIFVLLLLLFIIIVGKKAIQRERSQLQNHQFEVFDYDPDLGYTLIADTSVRFQLPGDTIFINRTSDSYGRRLTPRNPAAISHLLFFGCSYTYGQGCNDDGTMPWLISQFDTTRNTYNYALEGYGTQQMYDILKRGIRSQVDESNGTALYIYIEHHRERVRFDPFTVSWGYDFNSYALDDDGKLYNRGKFSEAFQKPVYFWKGIGTLRLWKVVVPILQTLFGNSVTDTTPQEHLLVAALVAESKDAYLQQFPHSRFIVVIYPGEPNDIVPVFRSKGLEVLDLSSAANLHALGGIQRDGFHPNRKGHAVVAELIETYLTTHHPALADSVWSSPDPE